MDHTSTFEVREDRRTGIREVTAARVMLEAFVRRGVRVAFGIPGGLISPIYDALADVPDIRLVTTRHEGMAAYAAMGHAIATGVPALVLTTSGPGITNAITGIAASFLEEIPMIVISGEVATTAATRGAIQDASSNGLDIVAMLRTITRWTTRVDSAEGVNGATEQAMRIACGARPGPVFISLPMDIGRSRTRRASIAFPEPPVPAIPSGEACREVAARLQRARKPLLVVGNGARGAAPELLDLAERLAIPVVTTPHAKGVFPESHPLHLGGIGLGGHPSATAYLEGAPDVVCIVGSKLGDYATNGWSIPLNGSEATFQIDREPWLIGRNYPVTLGVVGDAARALSMILAALPLDVARPHRESQGITRVRAESASQDDVPLKPARVLSALQAAFPDALWTCDQGEHCAYAIHYLSVDGPNDFRSMVGLASMGSGIGIGIGARHAKQDRPVICVTGDGCFAMHAGEILTCVEHGIDLILLVMNDGRYNMVHHGFKAVFGRMPASLPSHVAELAGVAREFGAVGAVLRGPADLDPERLRALAGTGRPLLLDARIDAGHSLSVESRSASLKSLGGGR